MATVVQALELPGVETKLVSPDPLPATGLDTGDLGYGSALDLDGGVAAVGSPNRGGSHFDAADLRDMSGALFRDGFESGDTTAWVSTAP